MGGLLPVEAGGAAAVSDGGYMPIGGSGRNVGGGGGGGPGGEAYRGVVVGGGEPAAVGGNGGRASPAVSVGGGDGDGDGDYYDAEVEGSTCGSDGGGRGDDADPATAALDAVVMAKVQRRLLPLLFAAALLCYLDRTNLSFAALEMNAELGLTPGQYGTGAAVFFCTYASLGVPAALVVKRVGAHRGLPALLAGWALASGGMGAITSVRGFYLARLAVGAAEAGFFPSVIYYLTGWFRQVDMGFSYTAIMTSTAVSGVLGGPLAGAILGAVGRWGGAAAGSGWRWLFVLEAAPTMVLAVVLALVLDAGPASARFLTTPERAHLVARQAREAAARTAPPAGAGAGEGGGDRGLLASLRLPWMRLLVAIWLLYSCAYYGLIFWLPLLLQASSVASAVAAGAAPASDAATAPVGLSAAAIGLASAVPYTAAAVGMLLVARSSDAACERRLHLAIPSFASAVGFAVAAVAVATAAGVGWVVMGVSIAAAGCWSLFGPYWAVPTAALSGDTAAAAFAAINSVGVVGGYVGPALVGALVGRGGAAAGGEGGGAVGSEAGSALTAAAAVAASGGYAAALGVFGGLMVVVGALALALDPGVGGRAGGGGGGRRGGVLRDAARWGGRRKGRPVAV